MQWILGRDAVSGILSPVIEGQKWFMDIETKETFKMEADGDEKECLMVGKYVFSKLAFSRAAEVLRKAVQIKQGWLIIDEVGPLELRGEGFYDILKTILNNTAEERKIILVIREGLVEDVLQKFGITKYRNFKPDL
ncbi:MAG: nucleoside-triphosphatase [Chitinophagales bacterium]